MLLRRAEFQDLPRLLELEQLVVEAERPFNCDIKAESAFYYDLEALIADDKAYVVVAQSADEIVATGYAQIRESKQSLAHESHGYLGFMYVTPEYRGQGLNAKIMDELTSWCRNRGILTLYLDVYAENEAAIKAYEKVGFKPSMVEMKLKLD